MVCPECGLNHRKFPDPCFHSALADNVHCIIAKLASNGDKDQKEFAEKSKLKKDKMMEYVKLKWPEHPQLKNR